MRCCQIQHNLNALNIYANYTTNTRGFEGLISGTTRVSQYQKSKINLDFIEARDSEWQWHQLSHMQVWTSLQTDNNTSTPPLSFLQTGCPSCCPNSSVKALEANYNNNNNDRLTTFDPGQPG